MVGGGIAKEGYEESGEESFGERKSL